jgi:hypothetical protein
MAAPAGELIAIDAEHKKSNGWWQIGVFATAIDPVYHRPKAYAALAGDLLQTIPKLVLKADTRFMGSNVDRALQNSRHCFPRHEWATDTIMSQRYDIVTASPFGQEKSMDLVPPGDTEVLP